MVKKTEADGKGLYVLFVNYYPMRNLKRITHKRMNCLKGVQLHLSIVIYVIKWGRRLQKHIIRQSFVMTK